MRPGLQCPGLITSQNFFSFQGFTVLSSRHGGQTLQELNLSMPDDLRRQQTPWIGANLFASMAAVHNKLGPSCARLLLSTSFVLLIAAPSLLSNCLEGRPEAIMHVMYCSLVLSE
jgi:hypothetical protein